MSESTKSMVIIGGGIIGLILVIILIVWIVSLTKGSFTTYEKLEVKMVQASQKYYAANPKLLPNNGEEAILNYDSLVREEFIKPLNEMLKDGDKCSAHVVVSNMNDEYIYTPYLNCPGSYETTELAKIILKNNDIVSSGSGLYADSTGGYYFRGEVTNNYIKLGTQKDGSQENDNIWRIMSVENDGTVKIRKYRHTIDTYVWDDRYNAEREYNYGYNNFEMSRIKSSLKAMSEDTNILDNNYISKLAAKKLCVGKRELNDTTKDGSAECSTMSEDVYYFGLMSPYEFMRVSLDDNCKNAEDESCSNYNYLVTTSSEWSLNATSENNYKALYFTGTNYKTSITSGSRGLYPTAYLNNKVFYLSGTGTLSDPYEVK